MNMLTKKLVEYTKIRVGDIVYYNTDPEAHHVDDFEHVGDKTYIHYTYETKGGSIVTSYMEFDPTEWYHEQHY